MILEAEIFKLYLLVFIRIAGLMVAAPVLGSGNFPVMAKAGLTAMTALLVTPTILRLDAPLPDEALPFAIMGAGEFLIGLMIGFVMSVVFSAIQVGGQIMDLQTGFGMMNVFNPALETQFPIFGFFLFILAVLYLLLVNGHHIMLQALIHTFDADVIPVGTFFVRPELLLEAARWGQVMFVDGLMIAAPIAAAMLLAYITMGLLGRLIPQIHLFVVGFPLTIAIGLFVTGLIIDVYLGLLDNMFYSMFGSADQFIRGMTPAS
ncbi:MAG: flagellar biosynthetic protein FliR [Candidatus Hydrogenedentes bacterium]|nr:flagellar biosynthetic protein FliR [Candidatus Hydrogenedentota bacterium]